MKITLKEIAKQLRISDAAVSMALNDKPGVSEQTRLAVKEYAKIHGYQSNRINHITKCNTIGLVVPDIENPYYSKMVACMSKYLRELGYGLEIGTSNEEILIEKQIIEDFISKQVDGIIISPVNKNPSNLTYYDCIIKRNIPAVFIATKYPGIPLPCIMVDLRKGSYNLVNYLFGEGREKIKFLSGPIDVLAFSERFKGCQQAFEDHDKEWGAESVIVCSRVDFEQAYFATLNILDSGEEVDTIITANDYMALGVLKALNEKNIRVPQDIAVAGYDDIIYASISNIAITTVVQDIERLCRITIDKVLGSIQNNQLTTNTTYIEPVLVIRDSTISGK